MELGELELNEIKVVELSPQILKGTKTSFASLILLQWTRVPLIFPPSLIYMASVLPHGLFAMVGSCHRLSLFNKISRHSLNRVISSGRGDP